MTPYKLYLFCIAFTLVVFCSLLQGQNLDTLTLNKHLQELDEIWDTGDYRKGIAMNTKMLEKVSRTDSNALRKLYNEQGRFYMNLGIMDSILPNAKKAYSYSSAKTPVLDKADYLNLIGAGFYRLNQMDSAEVNYLKSLKLKKRGKAPNERLAVSNYNLSLFYLVNSKYDKAVLYGTNALDYLKEEEEEDDFKADIYLALSGSSMNRGDLTMAEEYSRLAVSYGVLGYGEYHPRMGLIYMGAGAIDGELGQTKKAVDYNEKAVRIIEESYGKQSFFLLELLVNLALEYEILGNLEKAKACYQRASAITKYLDHKESTAMVTACWADFLMGHELENPKIEGMLTNALEDYKKTYGDLHLKVSETYLRLAKYHSSKRGYTKALLYLDDAKESIGDFKGFEKEVPLNPRVAIKIIRLRIKVYLDQYHDKGATEPLLAANNLIAPALLLAQNFVHDLSSEESIVQAQELLNDLYEVILEALYELSKIDTEKNHNDLLLKTFELGNSNSLLLSILESELKLRSNAPDSVLKAEEQSRKELLKLKEKLESPEASEISSVELSKLYEEYLEKRQLQDSLKRKVFASVPAHKKLVQAYNPEIMTGILNELDQNQQVVHYFMGERNLYYLLLSKGSFSFNKRAITQERKDQLLNLTSDYRSAKSFMPSEDFFNWLGLNELNENKKALLIIPNNILGYLPFETLQNKDGEMLMQHYAISYGSSLQLVRQLSRKEQNNTKSWAGFFTTDESNVQLKAANTEIVEISRLLKGDVYQDDEAKKKELFNAISTYDIVHLAVHSEVDENNPLFSKIYFNGEVVNAADIYGSSISSKMVVLSSCESGTGELKKGEGVMSLSRAFTYAGAASTVVSLWEVPDKETAKVMTLFYQHLKQGKAKDVALRDAKLEYLDTTEDTLLKHPYYRAGFVVTGDTSPLFSKTMNPWWIICSFGIFIVGFLVYQKKRLVKAA